MTKNEFSKRLGVAIASAKSYPTLIDELMKIYREMPADWISVEDELPINDKYVLAYSKPYIYRVVYRSGKKWLDDNNNEMNVTHWQYLPERPKKEKKGKKL